MFFSNYLAELLIRCTVFHPYGRIMVHSGARQIYRPRGEEKRCSSHGKTYYSALWAKEMQL